MKLLNNDENYRKYKQSLLLVLKAAMHKLYPRVRLVVHQSVGKAAYCELENELVTPQMLEAISQEMRTIISENLPILVFEVDKAQAAAIFHQQGELEKKQKNEKVAGRNGAHLQNRRQLYVPLPEHFSGNRRAGKL